MNLGDGSKYGAGPVIKPVSSAFLCTGVDVAAFPFGWTCFVSDTVGDVSLFSGGEGHYFGGGRVIIFSLLSGEGSQFF